MINPGQTMSPCATICRRALIGTALGLAALAVSVVPVTAFSPSASEANVFRVPPPTSDPAADLAAIKSAIANAKAWQAGQPKEADGLAAKVEVVLAPGTYALCPSGSAIPAPPQGGGGQYCLQFINWENLVFRGTGHDTKIILLDPDQGYIDLFQSRHMTVADLTLDATYAGCFIGPYSMPFPMNPKTVAMRKPTLP
jgi:hypothetical protein